nr:alpha/beta hydrolase [Actinokineospora inagensis]
MVIGGAAPAMAARIPWHGCALGPDDATGAELDSVGATCGELTVPLDYADPAGRKITIAVSRRPATDTRVGTLFLNGGGPGPSIDAVSMVARSAPAIAAHYDLVGVDPRFFGRSTPLDCGYPTGEYISLAQGATPDRPAFDRSVAIAADLAGRCTAHRDVLPYASTRNIARDLDAVRAALGVPRISYLAWSFGTYLGAIYTQLFPGRTDRVVLDSASDPTAYGPALTRSSAPADAAALRDWARWAADHNGQYGLGGTPAAVLGTVAAIHRAARRPLDIGGHRVDADMVPGLLLTVDDTDASYAELSAEVRVLRDAARRLPATPTDVLRQKLDLYTDPTSTPDFWFSPTNANQCADRPAWRDPEAYYADIRANLATEPFYGPLARHITPCAFWPVRPVEPPTRVDNAAPALIVSASDDPVTAYQGQLVMHRALTGSRMVTLAHSFRHGVYLYDPSTCVTRVVEHYLLDGVLPGADLTCAKG